MYPHTKFYSENCKYLLAVSFPLLKNIEKLTEEDRERLLSQLNFESKAIQKLFAILVTHTYNELDKIGTTTKALKILLKQCGMKELADEIKSTDTIFEIFDAVQNGNYWSFFNYELLEAIIRCFCEKTSLVEELEDYKAKFRFYCKRRLSQVPRESLKVNSEQMDQKSVVYVKMDETFCIEKSNLAMIKDIQCKLQTILKVETLHLVDVKSGCIELVFRYFSDTRLFPLSEMQKIDLTEIGVQWICCSKDNVLLKNRMPATTSAVTCDHTFIQPPSAPATTSSSLRHSHTSIQPSTPAAITSSLRYSHHLLHSVAPATTTSVSTCDHFLPKQQPPSSIGVFNPGILLV